MSERLFAFNRREVLDTTIWVLASNAKEARQRIDSHGPYDASDPKEAERPTYRRLPDEDQDA